jgi:hypothetical protein
MPKANTWHELLENVASLGKEDHSYKWVTIDTLDGAESLCRTSVLNDDFGGSISAFNSYGKGYAVASAKFTALLDYLDRLREKKRMGIIMLCHVGIEAVNSPIEGDYTKYTGEMHKKSWSQVKSWADQIGYASYDFSVIGADDSEGKKGKAKTRNGARHIQFLGHASLDTGCRAGYEMPDSIELSWDNYNSELSKLFTKKKGAK